MNEIKKTAQNIVKHWLADSVIRPRDHDEVVLMKKLVFLGSYINNIGLAFCFQHCAILLALKNSSILLFPNSFNFNSSCSVRC